MNIAFKPPGIFQIVRTLKEQGGIDTSRMLHFTLIKSPKLLLLLVLFFWVSNLALWQPLRKALFSWREQLTFSYGDFVVFFLLSLALATFMIVSLWKFYRAECELLAICNFGAATDTITFDAALTHYHFVDAKGESHNKLFAHDYLNLYPFIKRLAEDSREALPNVHLFTADGARKCIEEIRSGKKRARVFYLPNHPDICHLIIEGRMKEYFWRKQD